MAFVPEFYTIDAVGFKHLFAFYDDFRCEVYWVSVAVDSAIGFIVGTVLWK